MLFRVVNDCLVACEDLGEVRWIEGGVEEGVDVRVWEEGEDEEEGEGVSALWKGFADEDDDRLRITCRWMRSCGGRVIQISNGAHQLQLDRCRRRVAMK